MAQLKYAPSTACCLPPMPPNNVATTGVQREAPNKELKGARWDDDDGGWSKATLMPHARAREREVSELYQQNWRNLRQKTRAVSLVTRLYKDRRSRAKAVISLLRPCHMSPGETLGNDAHSRVMSYPNPLSLALLHPTLLWGSAVVGCRDRGRSFVAHDLSRKMKRPKVHETEQQQSTNGWVDPVVSKKIFNVLQERSRS